MGFLRFLISLLCITTLAFSTEPGAEDAPWPATLAGAGAGEGSLSHVLLHAAAGCASAALQEVDCGVGAAAGAAGAIYAGQQEAPLRSAFASDEAYDAAYKQWRTDVMAGASAVGTATGVLLSGGDKHTATVARNLTTSSVQNNYLYHAEAERRQVLRVELLACQASNDCSEVHMASLATELSELEKLDKNRDAVIKAACADRLSAACAVVFADLDAAMQSYVDANNAGDLSVDIILSEFTGSGYAIGLIGLENVPDGTLGVADLHAQIKSDILQNAFFNALKDIPVDAATGAIDFAAMSAAAAAGDEDAKLQLGATLEALALAIADPVGTVQAEFEDIAAQLDAARALEEAGDWAGAAEILGSVSADAMLITATAGTMGASVKVLSNVPDVDRATPDLDATTDGGQGTYAEQGDDERSDQQDKLDEGAGATNRTVPSGSPYSQADYDAYVQRKFDAGETPRSTEDYVQRRQQLDQNRVDGTRRQEQYRQEMADIHGEENVLTERYLRDTDGNIVPDPETGQARRLDCVVVNGQCGYAAEVTSPTADKDFQIRKEERIREEGGIYVENPDTGELIEITNTSDIIRLE